MTNLEIEALTLLSRWITAAEKRRVIEKACGWSEDYGGDKEIFEEAVALFQRLDPKRKP